ncbi:MAG: hypothetical protein FJ009_01360 [Chloroflexi bacterium]|nr:hypothetical protein [Chloroflexota bacterium]
MDRNIRAHFEKVIALAHARVTDVRVLQNDVTPNRGILQLRGKHNERDVWLKEIVAPSRKLYSYYLLDLGSVIVGFDNYPDLPALKMKFGKDYRRHLGDLVPHRHGKAKKTVMLTSEYGAEEFLENLDQLANS